MQHFYFGNAKVNISDCLEMPIDWEHFVKECPWEFEVNVTVSNDKIMIDKEQIQTFGHANVTSYKNGWLFATAQNNRHFEEVDNKVQLVNGELTYQACLHATNNYRECTYYAADCAKDKIQNFHNAFDSVLPYHGGSIIHASCVKYQDKAILFCGPSGMGKSTQARLWEKYRGTYMLSSDAPAVFLDADGAVAHGMPWDGSDHIITQESGKVAAVICLQQAKENKIYQLDEAAAFEVLMKQGHLPLWDSEAMVREMMVLKKMAGAVPFYRLECLPDEGAVEAVEVVI